MTGASIGPLLTLSEERKQREAKRAQERAAAERQRLRTVYLPLVIFASWQAIGAGFMLASAHTTDPRIGQVLYTAAFAVGYAGAFFHLVVYYTLGRERGDW